MDSHECHEDKYTWFRLSKGLFAISSVGLFYRVRNVAFVFLTGSELVRPPANSYVVSRISSIVRLPSPLPCALEPWWLRKRESGDEGSVAYNDLMRYSNRHAKAKGIYA